MKKSEIQVGGMYVAKVGNNLTTVRVDAIRDSQSYRSNSSNHATTLYDVTNLATGRKTTFRSAMKFRSVAVTTAEQRGLAGSSLKKAVQEAKNRPDPSADGSNSDGSGASGSPTEEGEEGSDPTKAGPVVLSDSTRSVQHAVEQQPSSVESARIATVPGTSELSKETPLASLLRKSIQLKDDAPHLIVEARAGTGKTTTLIEGLKRVKGIPSTLAPSPQQAAVWEQMELSKGKVSTICFVAFNRSIAEELRGRVPQGCEAMTMHSMGVKAVNRSFSRLKVSEYRVQDIISDLLGMPTKWLRANKPTVLRATEQLVGLCKMNLIDSNTGDIEETPRGAWDSSLSQLASHYDVDLNHSRAEIFELVPRVLERCKDPMRDGCIDYDDMIWLPVILNLPVFRYDLLLVDEAQDLNRCQQELAKRAGKRLILCGDPRQAIYGFAGADSESMRRMEAELHTCGSKEGCRDVVVLPLTVTRRCSKAIVAEARKIVPDFEAHESNPEGRISWLSMECQQHTERFWRTEVQASDMVLCRVNAPLVSECFKFIKAGKKANIQGRDVGRGLISTVEKMKAGSVSELITKLGDWLRNETTKEQAKRNPSEAKITALQDRHDCLLCFTEGLDSNGSPDLVVKKIQDVFTDNKEVAGIRLSSVHKAKGLESHRVFILQPKGVGPRLDKMKDWERVGEDNIRYVAITRAISELVFVS